MTVGAPKRWGPAAANRVRQSAAARPHRPFVATDRPNRAFVAAPPPGRDDSSNLAACLVVGPSWAQQPSARFPLWRPRPTRPQVAGFTNSPGLRTAYVAVMTMLSAREAARQLEAAGVGRRRTRQLLECGVAGQPTAAGGALLYDVDRVLALCAWPSMSLGQVDEVCPRGVFLARRYVGCQLSTAELETEWGAGWALSPLTAIWLRFRIEQDGAFPFVGALCGFVTHGADVTGVAPETRSTYRLTFAPPGEWFESLREHRVVAPGGKTFMVRGWPPRASSGPRPSTARAESPAAR